MSSSSIEAVEVREEDRDRAFGSPSEVACDCMMADRYRDDCGRCVFFFAKVVGSVEVAEITSTWGFFETCACRRLAGDVDGAEENDGGLAVLSVELFAVSPC